MYLLILTYNYVLCLKLIVYFNFLYILKYIEYTYHNLKYKFLFVGKNKERLQKYEINILEYV